MNFPASICSSVTVHSPDHSALSPSFSSGNSPVLSFAGSNRYISLAKSAPEAFVIRSVI